MNPPPWLVQDQVYKCWTGPSQNIAAYDYFVVEKSLAPFATFRCQCQDTPCDVQTLWEQVQQHRDPFAVEQQPEPSIQLSHTSYHFTEVVCCVPPSWLGQFVNFHLLLLKPLHAMLNSFIYCAHHPAGFVIFAQLSLLCLFIILFFPILSLIGKYNMAQTVSDSNHYLAKRLFELSGHQFSVFRCLHNFLLLSNHYLCGFNSLVCPSGLCLHIILDRFLSLSLLKKCTSCGFSAAASFWIASCAMPQGLKLFLPRSRSCPHSLDNVVEWNTLSTCRICRRDMATRSLSEHWPLYFVLTLLLGVMLDVARYGQYGGKLRLLCQGW